MFLGGDQARKLDRPTPDCPADVQAAGHFDFRSPEYRQLFEGSNAHAFQHPDWLEPLYRHLVPNRGAEPLIVTGRSSEGRLVFVLPLLRRMLKGVRLVEYADLGVTDYAAPVIAQDEFERLGQQPDLRLRVMACLGSHDLLRIKPVREDDLPAWSLFFDAAPERLDFSAHAAVLEAPYAAWRGKALDAGTAKTITRKHRRLAGCGDLRLEVVGPAHLPEAIAALQGYRAGRFPGDPIQSGFVRDFYTAAAVAGHASGAARTYRLSLDGATVGIVFGITHKGRFNYLLIGCDYENFGKHSPGYLLYDLIMADWSEGGGSIFDFTIGDEPFKTEFGTVPTRMYALEAARTSFGRLATFANGSHKAALKRLNLQRR